MVYICFADMVAIADELNPLAINHTAKTISSNASGIIKTIPSEEDSATTLNMPNKPPIICSIAPARPQIANHLGISFDWYNI